MKDAAPAAYLCAAAWVFAASSLAVRGLVSGAQAEQDCDPCPIAGDCADDSETLAGEADAILAAAGPNPGSDVLEAAGRLYRRARRLGNSPFVSLRAADLAAAAGNEEEAGDLLSGVGESRQDLLTSSDRLILARRAEAARRWPEAGLHYRAIAPGESEVPAWIAERLRQLETAAQAEAIASRLPASAAPEARLALADGKRALALGRPAEARERLRIALRLSPGYVEAALLLARLEVREAHVGEAIRLYRGALSTEPDRLETLVALSDLLWRLPDRLAKQESLELLDRAAKARPDARALLKRAALRWAEWGDAAKARDRLNSFRERATPEERRQTEALGESLAVREGAVITTSGEEASIGRDGWGVPSSAADHWNLAQVYLERGDPNALALALDHLAQAEQADPTFGRAPELAGVIHERRGQRDLAEQAYRRAIAAEPARASSLERLALLLARQPARQGEADRIWKRAEEAGSSEAIFFLAESARRSETSSAAVAFYRRYLEEAPGAVHVEEARRRLSELEGQDRRVRLTGSLSAALVIGVVGFLLARRRGGRTLEEWLTSHPERAHEIRSIVGRLRHEVFKHGGLLLRDSAARLRESAPAVRDQTAALLLGRLFGGGDAQKAGLVAESLDACRRLRDLAAADRVRLNLRFRDPVLAPVGRALDLLVRVRVPLLRIHHDPAGASARLVGQTASHLEQAADCLNAAAGPELEKIVERASATHVTWGEIREFYGAVADGSRPAPPLEPLGLFRDAPGQSFAVFVMPGDWQTVWRNLFANAIAACGELSDGEGRVGLSGELLRDPVTGASVARFVLADNAPATLDEEMIRRQSSDRGWGIVTALVRRNDGAVRLGPAPTPAYRKGIVVEFSAREPERTG